MAHGRASSHEYRTMAKLPPISLADTIDSIEHVSYPRPHLGASQIGHPCQRYLVYTFNWAYRNKISARLERTFRLGDAVEKIIIDALESVGIEHTHGQMNVRDITGFFGGSIDGLVENVPGYAEETMLFEAKSAKNSNFNKFKTMPLELSNPVYYAQIQSYMKHLKLDHALFCVMNKDTSELSIEVVNYNKDKANLLELIEDAIITADSINEFPKLSNNPSWFECKFCSAREICHGNADIPINCRTCQYREYHLGGIVFCTFHEKDLTEEVQKIGCNKWGINQMWV